MPEIRLDYVPRDAFIGFHRREERWSCGVCHRRSGKTVSRVADLVLKALQCGKSNPRFGYIAPFRQQAKEIAWTYLKEMTESLREGPPRESELRVKLINGAWVTLYGADNPDAMRGIYLDGAVLDEYGDMKPKLLGEVIMPTLSDRSGWLDVIGTPKGRNQFYDLARKAQTDPAWHYMELRASESGLLSEDELEQIRANMSEEEYQQEYECSFEAALKGTYYTHILDKIAPQIGNESLYDKNQKVFAAADMGYSDSTAWWFWQPRQDGFAIIDYSEAEGKDITWYLEMLADKGYDYQTIWLPHDAKAKTLQTGRSIIEQMLWPWRLAPQHYERSQKLPLRIVPKLKVQDGIEAVRMALPLCWFDRTKTFQGIEALRAYRRQYHEHTRTFSEKPLHDWASNAADGFRYFALVCKNTRGQAAEFHLNRAPRGNRAAKTTYGMSLDDLWNERSLSLRNNRRRI